MARRRIIETIVKPPEDAPGVTYWADARAPAMRFFKCEPFRAVLSQAGCADRWRIAQGPDKAARSTKDRRGAQLANTRDRIHATMAASESFEKCRGCPIGAAHAGERPVRYSQLYGQQICPRCRKGGLRMIGNRLCVSCYNRSREVKAGRNGRGNKPVELLARPARALELRMRIDGSTARYRAPAVDIQEPMLQVLRTTKGDVEFGFTGPVSALRQGRLF